MASKWLLPGCQAEGCIRPEKLMFAMKIVLSLFFAAFAVAQTKPQYEVYAIRYATIPDFQVSQLVAGADPARKLDIAMMVWLIKGNGRNILVDAGFYREQFFKQWHVTNYVRPSESIRRPE